MKTYCSTFATIGLCLGLLLQVLASPLKDLKVSGDTKWLLHLDLESFFSTRIGRFVNETLIASQKEQIQTNLKRDFDFDLDWKQIHSITAFGSDYQSQPDTAAVLLLQTGGALQAEFHQLLESKIDTGFGPLEILPIKSQIEHLYSIGGELYIALEPEGRFLLGKSRKQIEAAQQLLAKSQTRALEAEAFTHYPDLPNTIIFLAVADGLGELASVPPQARILQMSNGGRLAVCETDKSVLLQVELRTKDKKTSQQIHSVVQGMLSLVLLSNADERLTELAQAIEVSSGEAMVTLKLELPLERAMETLKQFSP